MKPANRYDSLLQYYWQKHAGKIPGVGWEFAKAIMLTENGPADPEAQSPAGAIGLFQIMPGTAEDLCIDPLDPEQSIAGGIRYYVKMWNVWKAETGNDRLKFACGSYNAGLGNILKAQARAHKQKRRTDLWVDIAASLPYITGHPHSRETIDYVDRIFERWQNI